MTSFKILAWGNLGGHTHKRFWDPLRMNDDGGRETMEIGEGGSGGKRFDENGGGGGGGGRGLIFKTTSPVYVL